MNDREKARVALIAAFLCLSGIFFLNREQGNENIKNKPAETTPAAAELQSAGEMAFTQSSDIQPEITTAQTEAAVKYENEYEKKAADILVGMSLTEKIYQLFIAEPDALSDDEDFMFLYPNTEEELKNCPVGGLIYFDWNCSDREQTVSMISDVQKRTKLGMFISVDEEGGEVARIGDNPDMGTTSFPDTGTIGDSGDVKEAYNEGFTIGTEIKELGFNLDFAPVADVNSNYDNPVIGTRAFSSDPEVAAEMVGSSVSGFKKSGILCTLKHFPGHGDTDTDSHKGYAETVKNLAELEKCEFIPFRAGIEAGAPVIMAGHITAPEITENDVPASLSEEIITGLLRNRLGYDGLVITDSMKMQAVTDSYSASEAAVMAINAGCDIILMPENLREAASGIETAVSEGRITEKRIDESVMRILKTKAEYGIIS